MSMCYAPVYGAGLVLSGEELAMFLEKYMETYPEQAESLKSAWEENDLPSFGFFCPDSPDEDKDWTEIFSVDGPLSDNMSCGRMYPFYVNGKANVYQKGPDGSWTPAQFRHLQPDDAIIWSERELDSPITAFEEPYKDYQEFKAQFTRLGKFLPVGFAYDAHIGTISNAYFG